MRKSFFGFLGLLAILSLLLTACAVPAPAAPAAPQVVEKQVEVTRQVEVTKQVAVTQIVKEQVVVTPTPGPSVEKVIEGVEPNAEISFWTYYLSPTFDDYIKATITRFQDTYPGVKVNWEDHQATFLQDYRNAFAAGNAPDVANLSDNEGWVSEFATKDLLLSMSDSLPKPVIDQYFPGLFNQQLVNGKSYQVPWYQAVAVELLNKQIFDQAGIKPEDFPKTIDGLPALCQTFKDKTSKLCDIRLTVNDVLSQMVYEGGVKVISDDGKKFTFDSPEGVAWLQMYVDMVKAGTVDREALVTDQDRVALDLFTSGNAPFFQTGPQLIRDVRSNNPGLYGYLVVVPMPIGKSGVTQPTSMAMSVKKDTKFPNASLALATFFTNPRSMLEFAKIVSVYPSTPASYEDPFFMQKPVAIEDSVKPLAKDLISKQADIKPFIPKFKDVNDTVMQGIQQALFNNVPAQQALSDAAAKANDLIK